MSEGAPYLYYNQTQQRPGVGGAYPVAGGYQTPNQPNPTPVPTPGVVQGTSYTNPTPPGYIIPAPATNNNYQQTQQPSNGQDPHINPATGTWDDNYFASRQQQNQPSGPSEADLNAVYDPSMQYLNQAESQVRTDYPNVLDSAQKAYETAIAELQGNKQKNLTTIGESSIKAGQQKEDALTSARRLYDQLRTGYQQRFGGSTSAGQAASEIASAEQQRQMGLTTRQYTDTMRQIDQQKVQLDTDYKTGVAKLEQNKQMAITQATSDFQNKLLSITQNRTQVESAKAQAKLQALQDLRNQVFTINQQNTQFQQTLEAQRQAGLQDVQNFLAKFNIAGGAAGTAATNFKPAVSSNLQAGSTPSTNTTGELTGQISPYTTKKYDTYNTNGPLTPYAQGIFDKQGWGAATY